MKLKALIVDDEYPARKELRFLLEQFENVEVVGEATNAHEALTLIKALDYSILFLDIQMPGMTGLELGNHIKELPKAPKVIFVTAYDEYAIEAFEVEAVDYLLKPIDEKRLARAIDKIAKAIAKEQQEKEEKNNKQEIDSKDEPKDSEPGPVNQIKIDRIPAEKQGKTILVNESDIIFAYTEQDYVYIKTHSDKLFTRYTLKELEKRLSSTMFFRTHRCYIVNLHKVREIVPFFNGTYTLIVEDGERSEVPVSRAQAKKLKKILGM